MASDPIPAIASPAGSPATNQLAELLAKHIQQSCQPGDKVPSLRSLARQHRVSLSAARAAVDRLARGGLLNVEHGRGAFVTARAWRPRVGLLSEMDLLQHHTTGFHRELARELVEFFTARNVEPEVYLGRVRDGETAEQPTNQRVWEDVAAGRLAGLVVMNTPGNGAWHDRIAACTLPKVGYLTPHNVSPDHESIVRCGLERLRQLGCQRVALLGWAEEPIRESFLLNAHELGLSTQRGWIRADLNPALQAAGWEEFREIWTHSAEKPDGLLIANDLLFPEVQRAIIELGIQVPDRLKVVTHVNAGYLPLCRFPVTFLQRDARQMAEALGTMLLAQLTGQAVPATPVTIPVQVIEMSQPEVTYGAAPAPAAVPVQAEAVNMHWSGLTKQI